LVDHLDDLRRAIITAASALAAASVAGYFLAPQGLEVIKGPLSLPQLVFFGPFDGLYLRIRLALIIGMVLAFPVIVSSFAWFIGPGLTDKEKKTANAAGSAAIVLFAAGMYYTLKVVLPLMLSFLLTFSTPEMLPVVSGEEYLTFVLSFLVYGGLLFNLPLVAFLLVYLDVLSPASIQRHRKWCLTFLFSCVLFFSPGGDLVTQGLMALPLYGLFEAAVFSAKAVHKFRKRSRGDEHV
jgi:sec-independent protein translocase protein TatC